MHRICDTFGDAATVKPWSEDGEDDDADEMLNGITTDPCPLRCCFILDNCLKDLSHVDTGQWYGNSPITDKAMNLKFIENNYGY